MGGMNFNYAELFERRRDVCGGGVALLRAVEDTRRFAHALQSTSATGADDSKRITV